YAHNVLPSTYGWQSVSYSDVWAGAGDLGFFDIEICQGAIIDETNRPAGTAIRTYIAARYNEGIDGTFLYYLDSEGNWDTPLTAEGGIPLSLRTKYPMTTADVNGVTYIYFQGAFGPYVLDTITGTLHMRVLEGLEIADIKGILATNGYLLAWSGISIAWSSTIDVEDFVPSDITDAGGGSIQEIKGNIVHCRLTDLGFIIFSDINSVIALYTSNSKFPFEFRELPAAGGLTRQSLVAREDIEGKVYAYSTAGLQSLNQVVVENVLPDVSDFLGARRFEDFDENTNTFIM